MSEDSESAATPAAEAAKVDYSFSGGLIARLAQLGIALAFTSYQSGLLYCLGRDAKGAHLHQAGFVKPMGLALDAQGDLALSAGFQILRLRNVLTAGQWINHTFDACYVARSIQMTGELDAHDLGIDADDRPVFVNTRYNCLATVSERHSFQPLWRPSFISALVDEDRCHLNGLAMQDGRAAYVTAVSRSDTIDGWRDRRADGGVVVEVAGNRVVCDGLSMPHSPRFHQGALWLLNSGTGELGVVDLEAGRFEPKVFCPGFLRGLAFHGNLAFVGLSKPRYKRFEGLALDQRLKQRDSEPWCGIQVIDLAKGSCVDWFRIDGAVGEIYDLAVLPGVACAMTVPPGSAEGMKLVTLPPESPAA